MNQFLLVGGGGGNQILGRLEVAQIAQQIGAKNLILWHPEMDNLKTRQLKYAQNAWMYFSGNIFVPNDLQVIDLK